MYIKLITCLYHILYCRKHFSILLMCHTLSFLLMVIMQLYHTEYDILICIITKGHKCQLDTTLYPTKKISWCPPLSLSLSLSLSIYIYIYIYIYIHTHIYVCVCAVPKQIKFNYNYKVKPHLHNVIYNF